MANFTKFLCWDPKTAAHLLDAEAEQHSARFFAATHSPVSALSLPYPPNEVEPPRRITEQEILSAFMVGAPEFDQPKVKFEGNLFMPIIGGVGSGKTHLIKWLHLRIPETDGRKVVLVPRINTTLRKILSLMIGDLQGVVFDEFRKALTEGANEHHDHATTKQQLLSQLAIAVEAGAHDANLEEGEKFIRTGLNALLGEKAFREHWLAPGGFIDRVSANASGQKQPANHQPGLEQPYAFTENDLPLRLSVANEVANAGRDARAFFHHLLNCVEDRGPTVARVNLQLEDAVSRLLGSGGLANLVELMTRVRQQYFRDGKELVVLIEDFARLQGVDRALLDALLARPIQAGEDNLCSIRTALACTTGYYQERVPDTAKTRATLHIQVGGLVDDVGVPSHDWAKFAGRYLNAVRLEMQAQTERENISNPCDNCAHKQACHAFFGSVEVRLNDTPSVVGLYPLNQTLLTKTHDRLLKEFSPRAAIGKVLVPILASHGETIKTGTFPTNALTLSLGGLKVVPETTSRLEKMSDGERQISLVNLWSSTADETGVCNGVRTAFSIAEVAVGADLAPKPDNSKPVPPKKGMEDRSPVPVEPSPKPDKTERLLQDLDEWSNGTTLPAEQVGELRRLVFLAVVSEINWLGHGFDQAFYARETFGLFRQTRICFNGDNPDGQIKLCFPLPGVGKADTAIALKSLVRRNFRGDWESEGGIKQYIIARTQVERWAAAVLKQIENSHRQGADLDPIAPAVESLFFMQLLGGATLLPECEDKDALQFLFQLIPNPNLARAKAWLDLQTQLSPEIGKVRDSLLNLVGCKKGEGHVFMLTPNRVLLQMRCLLRNYTTSDFKIHDLDKAGDPEKQEGLSLRRCNEFLRRGLIRAVTEEQHESTKCCDVLEKLFGLSTTDELSEVRVREGLKLAGDALEDAKDLGQLGDSTPINQLRDSILTLNNANLGELLAVCRHARDALGADKLQVAARVDAERRQSAVRSAEKLSVFLDRTHARLTAACENLTENTGIDTTVKDIVRTLQTLKQVVGSLQGGVR